MKLPFLVAAIAAAGLAPLAASAAPPARGEERVNALIVYGSDPCPRGNGDDIVVCARKPESERYRIPPTLRGDPNDPANQAWGARAESLEYVGRTGIGSCSTVGPGGWTGCFNQMVRDARAERGQTDVNMVRMIEDAREDRNKRIDAEQAAESAEHPVTPPK
jgi:hypothetical protein